MMSYENDELIIPKEYKQMSASELECEKRKLLSEIMASPRQKKEVKKNKRNIRFNL